MISVLNIARKVVHFTLGGTIEGDPDKTVRVKDMVTGKWTTQVTPFTDSQTAAFYQAEYPDINYAHIPVCNKDSKDIDGMDIGRLIHEILEMEKLPEPERPDRYLITLGTDRAVSIGIILQTALEGVVTRPIVLTASFVPLADMSHDHPDAPDNLRGAMETPVLAPNVYIKMGEIFDRVDRVAKDFDKETFYRVRGFAEPVADAPKGSVATVPLIANRAKKP